MSKAKIVPRKTVALPPTNALAVPTSRGRQALPYIVLFLLPLLAFVGPASLRTVFFQHDIQYYYYPQRALASSMILSGHLPLWNRFACCGIPFLGDAQAGILYPPNWLFLILPGSIAFTYATLLQFSVAGLGTFVYGRQLGIQEAAAFVGAIAYMFSGYMTARVIHFAILGGAAMLPWVILTIDAALTRFSKRRLVAAAFAVAIQTCCGHPQVPCYTALAVAVLTVVRAIQSWRATQSFAAFSTVPLITVGVYLLGLSLAALQLVPFAQAIAFSPRAAGATFVFVTAHSMEGAQWLLFLFPYLFGSFKPGMYLPLPPGSMWLIVLTERSGYVGILTLALSAAAIVNLVVKLLPTRRQRPMKITKPTQPLSGTGLSVYTPIFFLSMLILGILLASGNQTPFGYVFYIIPLLGRLRDVERAVVLISFALSGLAMVGMQQIVEQSSASFAKTPAAKRRFPSALIFGVVVALLPLAIMLAMLDPSTPRSLDLHPIVSETISWNHASGMVPVLSGLLSAAIFLYWIWKPAGVGSRRMAIGVVLLDMLAFASGFNPTMSRTEFDRPPQVLQAFAHETQPFRKVSVLGAELPDLSTSREMLAMGWSELYGIEDIEGMNPLQPKSYLEYLYWPSTPDDVSYGALKDIKLLHTRSPILDSLNVKYFIAPRGLIPPPRPNYPESNRIHLAYSNDRVDVFENLNAFPRAYFVNSVLSMANNRDILDLVESAHLGHADDKPSGFDLRHRAIVESSHFSPPPDATSSDTSSVTVAAISANSTQLHTQASAPRFLVLSEPWYPGWRATIDGRATEIYKTNAMFRGVIVPAGEHIVTFAYRPASVMIGGLISLVAVLVCAILLLPVGQKYRFAIGH